MRGAAFSSAECREKTFGCVSTFKDALEVFDDFLHMRMGHQCQTKPISALIHQLKVTGAEARFIGLDAAFRLHICRAEHAVYILIFAGNSQTAERAFAVFTVCVQNGQGIQRIFHVHSPHAKRKSGRDNPASEVIGSRAKRRGWHGQAAAHEQTKAATRKNHPKSSDNACRSADAGGCSDGTGTA